MAKMATGWGVEGLKREVVHEESPEGMPVVALGSSHFARMLRRVEGLHVFRGVLRDEIGRSFLGLLALLTTDDGPDPDSHTAIMESYARLFALLAEEVELRNEAIVGDPWQNHLLDRLLCDENPFSSKAQRVSIDAMGPSLIEAARHDVKLLREFFSLGEAAVFQSLRERLGDDALDLVPWDALRPAVSPSDLFSPHGPGIKAR